MTASTPPPLGSCPAPPTSGGGDTARDTAFAVGPPLAWMCVPTGPGSAASRSLAPAPLREVVVARRRAGRGHGRGVSGAAGHGVRRGRRAVTGRRTLGHHRATARVRRHRILPATV